MIDFMDNCDRERQGGFKDRVSSIRSFESGWKEILQQEPIRTDNWKNIHCFDELLSVTGVALTMIGQIKQNNRILILMTIILMINQDFFELSCFRADGRRFNEMRQSSIQIGIDTSADGSCLFKQGLTQVLCIIRGPYSRSRQDRQGQSQQLLKIQYNVAPFSSIQRREINKFDRQFVEFSENIRKSFENLILTEQYPKSCIDVIVTLLQNDGSSKSSILNSITLALINAGIAMRDFLVSSTVAFKTEPILDLTIEEEYDYENSLIISVIGSTEQLDYVELKEARMNKEQFEKAKKAAVSACVQMHKRMRAALREWSYKQIIIR